MITGRGLFDPNHTLTSLFFLGHLTLSSGFAPLCQHKKGRGCLGRATPNPYWLYFEWHRFPCSFPSLHFVLHEHRDISEWLVSHRENTLLTWSVRLLCVQTSQHCEKFVLSKISFPSKSCDLVDVPVFLSFTFHIYLCIHSNTPCSLEIIS